VRAVPNCIAAATRNDSQFNTAVSTENFTPLIARAAVMAQAHDTIYGGGGINFTNGRS